MRLPAVAIAVAFACGILLGLHPAVARNSVSFLLLCGSFTATATFILTGIWFVRNGRLTPAAIASLFSWVFLGFLGACVAERPRDPNHVISLPERGGPGMALMVISCGQKFLRKRLDVREE